MNIKITKKDIVWNYIGNIFNIGVNIVILPLILKLFTSDELGLWYVFSSIAALVNLMDFGFSPTIMRNITYAWAGAKDILKEGIVASEIDGKPNFPLVDSLLISARKIYLIISSCGFVLLITIGTLYIYSILPLDQGKNANYLIAWIIYSIGVFFNLFYSYWSPILKGIGKIEESNKAMIISKIVYILIAVISLIQGGGLLWLSFTYLISGLVFGFLSKRYFVKLIRKTEEKDNISYQYKAKDVFAKIWYNAKKQGIVTIGGWLITRASTLLCSSFCGLEITSKYGLSLQLFGIVGSVSSILFSSYIPELTSTKLNKENKRYHLIFARAITLQWLIGVVGVITIVFLGPFALRLIGSNSTLLSSDALLLLGIILFLEWNHSTFATLITLSNKIPFVKASLYSGVGIVALSVISLKFTNLGVLGLILSQGIIQISYNNWYWPRYVLKENNNSIGLIIQTVLKLKTD